MPRKPRSPRAVQVRGGRWLRPPRPKLIARPRSPSLLDTTKRDALEDKNSDSNGVDEGYETCDDEIRGDVTPALISLAQPVIQILAGIDIGAAKVVASLCSRLKKRERKLRKVEERHEEEKLTMQAQRDLQAQSARHWWKAKRLEDQVDLVKRKYTKLKFQHKQHVLVPDRKSVV